MPHSFEKLAALVVAFLKDESMKVVEKVWGEEHWIVNKEYCGKKLVLRKGFRCSKHHHKVKDETFYIIKGRVLMEVGDETREMVPGDVQHITVGCVHRFTGIEDSEIIEFSTHHDDGDSYRTELSGEGDPQVIADGREIR